MSKIGMQAQAPQSQDLLYFEQQDPNCNHCQVHALNNVLGACVLIPETLKTFIGNQYNSDPTTEGWLYAFDTNTGFSDDAINLWMLQNNLHS